MNAYPLREEDTTKMTISKVFHVTVEFTLKRQDLRENYKERNSDSVVSVHEGVGPFYGP